MFFPSVSVLSSSFVRSPSFLCSPSYSRPQAASVDLSIALAPLAVFATLNVFHGLLCKGGSWLRLFGACAALAQVRKVTIPRGKQLAWIHNLLMMNCFSHCLLY